VLLEASGRLKCGPSNFFCHGRTFLIDIHEKWISISIMTKQEEPRHMTKETKRKLREDLTKEEKERLEKYGVMEFKSAGATRKR